MNQRTIRIEDKLDKKSEKEDLDDLEKRVRTNEKTLVKHKTIGAVVVAALGSALAIFR